jgi:hypothetical protein
MIGTPQDPGVLAKLFGVDLDNPTTDKDLTKGNKAETNGQAQTNGQPGAATVDLSEYPRVLKALELTTVRLDGTTDRSVDAHRVARACFDAGLTAQACEALMQKRRDLADWLDENPANEVARSYAKFESGEAEENHKQRTVDGATFILNAPEKIPAVWGRDDEVLWPEGESLMIAGGLGLGKTTMAGLLVRELLFGGDVLGLPVLAADAPILYLAMDRPRQISRSMRRQFTEQHQRRLKDRLIVWEGPLEADLAKKPELLVQLADRFGAGHVFIDSLKDAVIGLSEDENGAAYNRARQLLIARGIQLCELHHLVKRASGSADDVYGSRWLTAGCGSLIVLTGDPGDPIVSLRHKRQPVAEVGPYQLLSYQNTGEISICHSIDLIELARAVAESGGLTVRAAACALFEKNEPDRNEIEKARRKLDSLTNKDLLRRGDDGHRGGAAGEGEAKWVPA